MKFQEEAESIEETGGGGGTTEASTKAPGGPRRFSGQDAVDEDEQAMYNGQIEKTAKEIEELQKDYQYNLEAKSLVETAEITLYQD